MKYKSLIKNYLKNKTYADGDIHRENRNLLEHINLSLKIIVILLVFNLFF